MKAISGKWYAARSSRQRDADLRISARHYTLVVEGFQREQGSLHTIGVSDRTGNIARKLTFPDGSLFETWENDAIDAALAESGHVAARTGIFHRLESSWSWVAAAVILVVALTFGFFKWGLPYMAKRIALALPVSSHEVVATGSLQILDRVLLTPTALSPQRQEAIRQRFDNYLVQLDADGFDFRLHFRQMQGVPNALALPSGEIIVTDALVELVADSRELDAVLFHEIGHVLKRHGMQHVVQASAVTLIISLALGDVSGLGEIAVGVPTFLLQSSYARQAEAEADEFAFDMMTRVGVDPVHFASVILKLERAQRSEEDDHSAVQADGQKPLSHYLASHPDAVSRALKAKEYSRRHFRQ